MNQQDARADLARRIRQARAVTPDNDPQRDYRRRANLCRLGRESYNRNFGIGKVKKHR